MDRDQDELRFLGFFDIFSESAKLINKWRNIFVRITATLILPLSILFLSHNEISMLLSYEIMNEEDALDHTAKGTATYDKISDILSTEWVEYLLVKVVYFTFLLVLFLLSTSGIVYTVACIYSAKEITHKKVMSVVPKVWKRLMLTFLCSFAVIIAYNIFAFLILVILLTLFAGNSIDRASALGMIVTILYLIGFVYISLIWHLASVISVLEDIYGFRSMLKSKALIKGKTIISAALFIVISLCLVGTQFFFRKYVMMDGSTGVVGKALVAYLSMLMVSMIFLFGLVIQAVIYFVCKSYHHENIDKSNLSDHLQVYLGEYVPLNPRDIQLEHV